MGYDYVGEKVYHEKGFGEGVIISQNNKKIKVNEFASRVLGMEREALRNINKTEDKVMVARIIKEYEKELEQNDN